MKIDKGTLCDYIWGSVIITLLVVFLFAIYQGLYFCYAKPKEFTTKILDLPKYNLNDSQGKNSIVNGFFIDFGGDYNHLTFATRDNKGVISLKEDTFLKLEQVQFIEDNKNIVEIKKEKKIEPILKSEKTNLTKYVFHIPKDSLNYEMLKK